MMDYTKLVEALRYCAGVHTNPTKCPDYGDFWCDGNCLDKHLIAAADAIEALQAELPKLGEWQKAKPKGVVTYSDGYAECSHCHEAIWLGWGMNFCPNCGTQNKIIDPDDYDGAKMEVQDGSR